MAALQHVGADAPGPVTRTSDEPRGQAGSIEGSQQGNGGDCGTNDCTLVATLISRAALLGIEVHERGGAWLVRHAHGADIGVVRGVGALAAIVLGLERAVADTRRLVRRLQISARGGAA